MKVSGKGCSSWQRAQILVPCSQNSRCTAELSAGCHRRPWRGKTASRNASGPSPSTACKTRWGRQMSASWRMWCSMPEMTDHRKFFMKLSFGQLFLSWTLSLHIYNMLCMSDYEWTEKNVLKRLTVTWSRPRWFWSWLNIMTLWQTWFLMH